MLYTGFDFLYFGTPAGQEDNFLFNFEPLFDANTVQNEHVMASNFSVSIESDAWIDGDPGHVAGAFQFDAFVTGTPVYETPGLISVSEVINPVIEDRTALPDSFDMGLSGATGSFQFETDETQMSVSDYFEFDDDAVAPIAEVMDDDDLIDVTGTDYTQLLRASIETKEPDPFTYTDANGVLAILTPDDDAYWDFAG